MMNSSGDPADTARDLLLRLRDSPDLFAAIAACTPAERANQKTLRSRFPDELVRAALALDDARVRAEGRLPNASQLWLTATGLEQSTAPEVARHKAARFAACNFVSDLCSGIGIDAAALSAVTSVEAFDLDPAMALRCQWNGELLGNSDHLKTTAADVTSRCWSGKFVHADPDRRVGRNRPARRLEAYQPDLNWMQQLTANAAGGAIKIGPASNFQQKFPGCEIELVSLAGECREATVWFGELAGESSFRATCLDTGESVSGDPLSAWADQATHLGHWLIDPDPAIVRSGLLDLLAETHQLQRLDPEEEYLTADRVPETGFVTGFQVEAILPGNPRELSRYFRSRPASEYEIRCRRIPLNADAMRKKLPAGTHPPAVVVACRINGRSRFVIARRGLAANTAVQED